MAKQTDELVMRGTFEDNASAPMRGLRAQFESLVGSIRKEGLAFVFVGQEFVQWGRAITDSLKTGIDQLAEYDKALTQFSVIATDSSTQAKGFGRDMEALSVKYGESATNIALASRDVAAMGLDAATSMRVVAEGMKLATGGLSDVNTASILLVNTMKQYNISISEAGHLSDVFAAVSNKTAANVTDLSIAMQYAGPIASALGLSIEETAAAMGIMRNAGIDASIVGTNLRQMLVQLQAPTKEATLAILDAGLEIREETAYSQRLRDELKRASEELKGFKQRQEELETSIDGVSSRLDAAITEQERHRRAIENAQKQLAYTNEEYRKYQQNLAVAQSSLDSFSSELMAISGVHDDLGDSIRDNNIEIMSIQRAAAAAGRELTAQEISKIEQLRNANEDLRLQQEIQARSMDNVRERMEEYTRQADDAKKSMKSLSDDAIKGSSVEVAKLDKVIDRLRDTLSDNTAALKENKVSIKAAETNVDSLSEAYSKSGGHMISIVGLLREVDRATKGMTIAQKESFLNTILGIRGMAAYNTLINQGAGVLDKLTGELRDSSGAFGGLGFATNASTMMLNNYKTELDIINAKMQVFERQMNVGGIEAVTRAKGALSDFLNTLASSSPALSSTIGMFGLLGGSLLQIIGHALIVYPLWSVMTVKTVENSAANVINTGTRGASTAAIAAQTAAISAQTAATAASTAGIALAGGAFTSYMAGTAGAAAGAAGLSAAAAGTAAPLAASSAGVGAAAGASAGLGAATAGLATPLAALAAAIIIIGGSLEYYSSEVHRARGDSNTFKEDLVDHRTEWEKFKDGVGAATAGMGEWFATLDFPVLKSVGRLLQSIGGLFYELGRAVAVGIGALGEWILSADDVWRGLGLTEENLKKVTDGLGWFTEGIVKNQAALNDWFASGINKGTDALREWSDSMVGHSAVPDTWKFYDAIKAVTKSGGAEYMMAMARAADAVKVPEFGAYSNSRSAVAGAFGSVSPINTGVAPTVGGTTSTSTIRNTTNSPNINFTVQPFNLDDPVHIRKLEAAIKRVMAGV